MATGQTEIKNNKKVGKTTAINNRVYFDYNGSAPLRPASAHALTAALSGCGNPSSVHQEGRHARKIIETARQDIAVLASADPRAVIFTSGGTEANILALGHRFLIDGEERTADCLMISAIEHPSVLSGGRFRSNVHILPVDHNGLIQQDELITTLKICHDHGQVPLVSIMLANNETGVIQPIAQLANLIHEAGGIFHVDAIQGFGRINVDINALGADFITISAHKIGGPQGIGALIACTANCSPEPILKGGGQEKRLRAGTENVAAIVGFGAAAREIQSHFNEEVQHFIELKKQLESGLRSISPDIIIYGEDVERLANTTLFSLPGLNAETAVIAFDLAGIAISSGSACSSGKVTSSHVLTAMGVAEQAGGRAIRASIGFATTEHHIERFLDVWRTIAARLNQTTA